MINRLLTHPQLEPWLRGAIPWGPGGLVLALVFFVAATFTGQRLWLLPCAGLLAMLGLAYLWPRWMLSQLQCQLEAEGTWYNQSPCILCVQLRSPLPLWGLQLSWVLPCGNAQEAGPYSRWHSGKLSLSCEPQAAGHFGPVQLRADCGFPFGLWPYSRWYTGASSLMVLPKLLALRPLPLPLQQAYGRGFSHWQGHSPWRPGQPSVGCDQLAQARTGEAQLRLYDQDTAPVALLALEARADFQGGQGSQNAYSHQLQLMLALGIGLSRGGYAVYWLSEQGHYFLPAFSQNLLALASYLAAVPRAQTSALALLEEHNRQGRANLLVLTQWLSQSQAPACMPGQTLWQLLFDDNCFGAAPALTRHSHRQPNRQHWQWIITPSSLADGVFYGH
jgi:hypothetical protein